MNEIRLTIPGQAIAKQSARFCQVAGFIKSYQKKSVINYANFVKMCFLDKYPEFNVEELKGKMLSLEVIEYRAIPTSKTKKFKVDAEKGILRPITKPDCDNVCKNIADGLNGIAYPDDRQIVDLHIAKKYSNRPRVEVIIKEYKWDEKEKT